MRLFNKQNIKSIYHRLLLYIVEIAIIFIGITISFLFEQWREDKRQKQELIELAESLVRDAKIGKAHLESDLNGTNKWLQNLDSLRIQRDGGKISESELFWFYNLLNGQEFGLFESKSPAYLSAISNGLLTKLPDSIQMKIYGIYENRLPDLQHLYEQQNETARYFRNEIMIKSPSYLFQTNTSTISIDIKQFAREVQQPVYGNLINQFYTAENEIRRKNLRITKDFDSIVKSLGDFIEELRK